MNIAIVNSSSFGKYFPDHINRLKALGDMRKFSFPVDIDGRSLAEALNGFDIIVASVKPNFHKEFFDYKDTTRLIVRHGIGYDNVDVKIATSKKCVVTKVAGWVEREAVAETAITLLLDIMRKTHAASDCVREGRWSERAEFVGWEIKDKNVGIIGIGNIGSRVCEILKYGFGANVMAYDPNLESEKIKSMGAEPVDLSYLLENADIISLNASLNETSRYMISYDQFASMKTGVFIVNTARGELIDQNALIDALRSNKIAAIGMDVVENEPIDENHPLLKFSNVMIVPHIAAYTIESLRLMGDKVVKDIECIAAGERPEEIVNPDVLCEIYKD